MSRRRRRPAEICHFTASNCPFSDAHFGKRHNKRRYRFAISHLLGRLSLCDIAFVFCIAPSKWVCALAKIHLLGMGAILRAHVYFHGAHLVNGAPSNRELICSVWARFRAPMFAPWWGRYSKIEPAWERHYQSDNGAWWLNHLAYRLSHRPFRIELRARFPHAAVSRICIRTVQYSFSPIWNSR